ncbi:MAG: cation:proton antiporter [Bacteriovoracaceae bacterium]|nr:cation:proton antiporter [Bacteriovoracaceae bacterium]
MDNYFISLAILGLLGFLASWFPFLLKKINVSYSIGFLLLGWLSYSIWSDVLPWPNPIREQELTVKLTELLVIVALMATGLRIDRRFSLKSWKAPLRLVGIYMLLSACALSSVSYFLLGLPLSAALLLGAVTAPTDPVLASDVQVGPPNSTPSDEVRFSLTAEAGLNDGLAFPLTWLAIAVAQAANNENFFWSWLEHDVFWRLGCGAGMGFLAGKLVAYFFISLPEKIGVFQMRDGLVALSATIFTYGLTEMFNGYGFIAVFISSLVIRSHEFEHEYHEELHSFIDQVERAILSVLIFLFGGSLYSGILGELTTPMFLTAIIFVLVFRPLAARLSLIGVKLKSKEKWAISFFGIKGVGSFFYLAFALKEHDFPFKEELWAFVACIVLISIVTHGLTAILSMKKLNP